VTDSKKKSDFKKDKVNYYKEIIAREKEAIRERHLNGATGREIVEQFREREPGKEIDAFVAGTGTGGTLMGVRARLLREFPDIKTFAVEPAESAVMSGREPGIHKIQGIGDGFIPDLVDMSFVNGVKAIKSDDAISMAKTLFKELGLNVGISSGANVIAAIEVAQEFKYVVTVLPDNADRYKSMGL